MQRSGRSKDSGGFRCRPMRIATVCAVLWGIGYGWTSEDGGTAPPPPPAWLSVYNELTWPGQPVLYAAPGVTFFNPSPASSSSFQRPRSVVLDRQFRLGGQVPVQTRFLFLPTEEKREEDPLLRFQQRMQREYGFQGAPAEDDHLARSALQMNLEQKLAAGSLAASFTTVGAAFDQDQPYGLERGTQRTALTGRYNLQPNLSLATEFTRLDRQALAQRQAGEEEVWRNQLQFQPSEASQWQVAHERIQGREGLWAPRMKETIKVAGTQQLSAQAKLTLERRQEEQQEASGEQRKQETAAQLQWDPSRWMDVKIGQKRQQNGSRTPQTTDEVEIRYRPPAPLSVKSRYTQEEEENRWKQKREMEMEVQPMEVVKVTTGFQQVRKPGERYDTQSLHLEATPGAHTKLKTGFQEEEKSWGNRERTQTAELEFQPTAHWSVNGRYREKDERQGPEKVSQSVSWSHRPTDWLTVRGSEESEWKEGRRTEAVQCMGAEGQLGDSLSFAVSRERREKAAAGWEARSIEAAYRPSEALQISGRYSQRTDAAAQVFYSHQANVEVRPRAGVHLLGSLAENPEEGQGRVILGRRFQVQMQYQVTPSLSLSGSSARREDEKQRMQRQETELGLSLGSEKDRLSSRLRLEQTLSLGRQFLTEYRLGYSRQIGSHLSWSLEGTLQRWEDRYGPIGSRQEEYRGEAKLNLSF